MSCGEDNDQEGSGTSSFNFPDHGLKTSCVKGGTHPQECPAGGLGWGPCHLHVSDERSGAWGCGPSTVVHDVVQHGLSPAVAAACACPSEPGCALLWTVPSYPRGGAGALPGAGGAAARGYPGRARLADSLCPAGRGAPGTVSHLRAAAGVYRGHPAGRCAPASSGWGARGMRPTPDRRPGEGGQAFCSRSLKKNGTTVYKR
jgi:hypothetical protein